MQALEAGAHDYLTKPPDPAELAARVAAAVRVKVLQDQLRARAVELDRVGRTDWLTGLHNRRHLEEQLRAQLALTRRHGVDLSAVLIDVDRFKAVNDEVGHSGGDAVLCEVAARLRSALRQEDLVGRWGGEEFLVLAPHTDLPALGTLTERLRAAVAATPVPLAEPGAGSVPVTVSLGGAAVAGGADVRPDEVLRVADANLYAAKDAGRDRAHVSALD